VLRGVLAYDVLKVVLSKRWRLQYGNHPTRKNIQMAVPYRAKDVAAERTEFGHQDVALSLTFAHYFQAGLSIKQLRDVFERLKRMSESEAKVIYLTWVANLPNSDKKGFASYEGVNIEDGVLFETKIFPVFRKHMLVIRFWLFNLILPIQAKQFPKKLLATAPDLQLAPSFILKALHISEEETRGNILVTFDTLCLAPLSGRGRCTSSTFSAADFSAGLCCCVLLSIGDSSSAKQPPA
jgi:hypothetical protein